MRVLISSGLPVLEVGHGVLDQDLLQLGAWRTQQLLAPMEVVSSTCGTAGVDG